MPTADACRACDLLHGGMLQPYIAAPVTYERITFSMLARAPCLKQKNMLTLDCELLNAGVNDKRRLICQAHHIVMH